MALPPEDVVAIEQLVARYNFAFDAGDGDSYAACFTPEGRFLYSSDQIVEGREALRAFPAVVAGVGQLRHVVTSLLAEGDGDRARTRSYCQVFAIDGNGRSYVLSQGVYEDDLTKLDGAWLFAERRYLADPVGTPDAST